MTIASPRLQIAMGKRTALTEEQNVHILARSNNEDTFLDLAFWPTYFQAFTQNYSYSLFSSTGNHRIQ
jgi:hypothetical protein